MSFFVKVVVACGFGSWRELVGEVHEREWGREDVVQLLSCGLEAYLHTYIVRPRRVVYGAAVLGEDGEQWSDKMRKYVNPVSLPSTNA